MFTLPMLRASHALPLLGLLAFGPALHLGGAPASAVPLWSTLALAALFLAGIEWTDGLRRDRLFLAGSVMIAVMAIQLVPLPPRLLAILDSASANVSAGALSPYRIDRAAAWRPLHLDPGSGYADLQYVVGLLAAYLAAKRVAARGHGDTVLLTAACATLWIAIVALAHRLWGLEKVYGYYAPSQAAPPLLSPILNPNHLAAFTGAGAVLWIGRAAALVPGPLRIASGVAAALCFAVCALTLSRGGIAAALGGVLLAFVSTVWGRTVSRRRSSRALFDIWLVVCGALSAALFVGWQALRAEYVMGDYSKLGQIVTSLRALRHHFWFGAGSGGLHAAAAMEGVFPGEFSVVRAESLPVDLAIALGPAAALVVMYFAARWLWAVRPSIRNASPALVAAFCALLSLVAHDMVDFALWLGATGYLAALMAGVLAGSTSLKATPAGGQSSQRPRAVVRAPLLLAVAGCVAASFVTLRSPVEAERDRIQSALRANALDRAMLQSAMLRHPGDPFLPLAGAAAALRSRDPNALRFVARAMELSPRWAEPHAMLARVLAAHGLTSQALLELRYAVGLSGRTHGALANLIIALDPDRETLARAVPPGALGNRFLTWIADRAGDRPIGERSDALLLERDPHNLGALHREIRRAHTRGDTATERRLAEELLRSYPADATGYRALAEVQTASGDLIAAESTLRRGIEHTTEVAPLLLRLAEIQARRRDVPAMRVTMMRALEAAGADIDQRIATLGHLGSLEESLGNDASALSAFERADAMASPEHPYLGRIIAIAYRLRDLARLRGACGTLRDLGAPLGPHQEACNAVDRERPALESGVQSEAIGTHP